MEQKKGRSWLKRVLDFINPLRDPSLTVAVALTFIIEIGQHHPWYTILLTALVSWIAVRGIVWLVVNFTFASVFLGRRLWWSMQHPQLAWRILDAVGHEEIVIGGNASMTDIVLQDGTTLMSPMLGASGIHIIGELPAGTELPMLGMPGSNNMLDGSGFFPSSPAFNNAFPGQSALDFQQHGSMPYNQDFVSTQSTDGLPQQRPSQEEERLRQQMAALTRLMDDWIQYTEEKWRTVNDGQLGWKPLRGRWASWDDIFHDVYAAKTSDPMAEAAQSAGEATSRRYENSKEKGSAASAVACFMRDMMTLRRGLDLVQQPADHSAETPYAQPSVGPSFGKNFGQTGSSLHNGSPGGVTSSRSTLIRRPAQIFVDADSKK